MSLSVVAAALEPIAMPYYFATTSADSLVSSMARKLGAFVLTQDSDHFAYGVRATVRTNGLTLLFLRGVKPEDPLRHETKFRTAFAQDFAQEFGCEFNVDSLFKQPKESVDEADGSRGPTGVFFENGLRVETSLDLEARAKAYALTGDRLVQFWTRMCEEADDECQPEDQIRVSLAKDCEKWILERFKTRGACLGQFAALFVKGHCATQGYLFPKSEPDPLFACTSVLATFASLLHHASKNPGPLPKMIRMVNISSWKYPVSLKIQPIPRHVRTVALDEHSTPETAALLLYECLDLADVRSSLEVIPGWRRTVALAFSIWSHQEDYPIDEVFLKAAILTHMCACGLLPAPRPISSLMLLCAEYLSKGKAIATPRWKSTVISHAVTVANFAPLGAYEALKAVATWLDPLLTLLGFPLPPFRPEKVFIGPLFSFFAAKLQHGGSVSSIVSKYCPIMTEEELLLASDYMRAVLAACKIRKHDPARMIVRGVMMEKEEKKYGLIGPKIIAHPRKRRHSAVDPDPREDKHLTAKRQRVAPRRYRTRATAAADRKKQETARCEVINSKAPKIVHQKFRQTEPRTSSRKPSVSSSEKEQSSARRQETPTSRDGTQHTVSAGRKRIKSEPTRVLKAGDPKASMSVHQVEKETIKPLRGPRVKAYQRWSDKEMKEWVNSLLARGAERMRPKGETLRREKTAS